MTSTSTIPAPDLASNTDSPTPSYTHTLPTPFDKTSPVPTLLTQGAEALVYRTTHLSPPIPAALKYRPSKPYRHPTLDQRLTKQRVLAEARVLVKLSALKRDGINVPAVLALEWDVGRKVKGLTSEQKFRQSKSVTDGVVDDGTMSIAAANSSSSGAGAGAWLLMEWIDGKSLKELVREYDAWLKGKGLDAAEEEKQEAKQEVKSLLRRVGRAVAAMHAKGGVVHGDLTSSNIMVRPSNIESEMVTKEDDGKSVAAPDMKGEIVLIDFGLATQSVQDEDRAVDLYVLERAFGSTHPKQEDWFDAEVLQSQEGYRGAFKGANVVLKRLDEVRLRGRKRSMIG